MILSQIKIERVIPSEHDKKGEGKSFIDKEYPVSV
jgi:hypothetical protein